MIEGGPYGARLFLSEASETGSSNSFIRASNSFRSIFPASSPKYTPRTRAICLGASVAGCDDGSGCGEFDGFGDATA